jgi:Na+/H+ antiporter NhaA
MFLVWQFFVKNLLSVVLVLFPDIIIIIIIIINAFYIDVKEVFTISGVVMWFT